MDLNPEQLQIVKKMYIDGKASNEELELVRMVCKSRGLDPFAGHVAFSRRGGKLIIMTTIDGLRTKAARTKEFAGCDKVVFHDDTESAEKTVYRLVGGQRCPFTAVVFLKEMKGSSANWRSMPRLMLAKCAEAAALRMGFADECGGEYLDVEPVDGGTAQEEKTEVPDEPSNDARWLKVKAAFAEFGFDEATILQEIGVKSVEVLTEDNFSELHNWYKQCKDQLNDQNP